MRLFVGIEVPKKANAILKAFYPELIQSMQGYFTEHLHCTLKFLGECDESELPTIKESLSKISMQRFVCELNNFGHFGTSVFYAAVESQELMSLQKQVAMNLSGFGLEVEHSSYIPHITLVRIKSILSQEKFQAHIHHKLPAFRFDVLEFVLFRSTLTHDGPKYEALERFPLSGPKKVLQTDYRLPPL